MNTPQSAIAESAYRLGHGYGTSQRYSLGVEEEFQLLHPESFHLVSRAESMLADATAADLANIKPELMQSVIETATGVCSNTAEAAVELADLRRRVGALAEQSGCRIGSAGTHPFSRYEFQKITDSDRYRQIVSRLRWIAERELIFGLHVHVGMSSPEQAMYVFNGIRNVLPEMLALSANSPFWQGRETGLQSTRSKVFDAFPRSGVPEAFDSWADYESLVLRAMEIGAIDDYSYIWWDVRPHPRFGTIEVRVCDAQTRLQDSMAIAALIQATCAWLGDAHDEGRPLESQPTLLIEENKWSATRYGLDGEMLDFESGERVPTREAIGKLIERVSGYARTLGAEAEFAGLESLLVQNGAQRQLDVYRQTGSLMSVGRMLAEQTDCPR